MSIRPSDKIEPQYYLQWIDAATCESTSSDRFERSNPAHDVVVGTYNLDDVADTDRAVVEARKAFNKGSWTRMSDAERSRILFRATDLIEKHKEELALADVFEGGKPITQVRAELDGTIDLCRYAAGRVNMWVP
jgi:acyl-CoA reductase-like NAD-dependent aldehyde dehydrogenase